MTAISTDIVNATQATPVYRGDGIRLYGLGNSVCRCFPASRDADVLSWQALIIPLIILPDAEIELKVCKLLLASASLHRSSAPSQARSHT